jgi:hypothetical protein
MGRAGIPLLKSAASSAQLWDQESVGAFRLNYLPAFAFALPYCCCFPTITRRPCNILS